MMWGDFWHEWIENVDLSVVSLNKTSTHKKLVVTPLIQIFKLKSYSKYLHCCKGY